MNQKFQAAVHQKDDVTYVKLGGVIDEDNELGELTERIPPGTAVIDLAEIERINSCGVRDWVNWLTRVEKQNTKVVLVECSPAIVAQINLVNNFTGGGVVKSFFAPYFCPNCDREKVLLVETSELAGAPHKAPTCRCDECDGVMDFDDMEDSYFAFLSTSKKVTEVAKINAVVTEFNQSQSTDDKSKIRSRVGTNTSGLGISASSLPSVPSLPSLQRGGTGAGSVPGSFSGSHSGSQNAPSAGSLPGMMPKGFGGGGSHPGITGSDPGRYPGSNPDARPTPVVQPRNGKMVYVLVAVLIAAICVLAVLLFSGGGRKG